MSLINDALKRAKKAQQDNPPPAAPLQLRAAEPPSPRHSTPFILLLLALVVLLIAGGLLLWTFAKQPAPALRVEARTMTPPVSTVAEAARPNLISPAKPESVVSQTAGSPTPATTVLESIPDETLPGQPETNGLPVVAIPEPPKPAAPKLQAILYSANRPSAIINGRTVFPGDRVGDSRVLKIMPDGVMLGSATATNVLSLGE
jgi:hypothetical protein